MLFIDLNLPPSHELLAEKPWFKEVMDTVAKLGDKHGQRDPFNLIVFSNYRDSAIAKYFRGDAAFAIPELYVFLEAERYLYAIRLKSNQATSFLRASPVWAISADLSASVDKATTL